MSLEYLEFSFSGGADTDPHAFLSLASAGDMKYDLSGESDARLSLFAALNLDPGRVVGIQLRHSRNVAFIESREELRTLLSINPGGFDGIVTRNRFLVPSVTVADCMPIYIRCRHCGAFGVLHSGWKGTGILNTAVEGMHLRCGCSTSDISLILGPSIGSCCYSVDEARAKLFAETFGSESVRVEDDPGAEQGKRYFLDLVEANIRIAASLGIEDVAAVRACTACDGRFSSFRRDGSAHFSRMLALVARPFPN